MPDPNSEQNVSITSSEISPSTVTVDEMMRYGQEATAYRTARKQWEKSLNFCREKGIEPPSEPIAPETLPAEIIIEQNQSDAQEFGKEIRKDFVGGTIKSKKEGDQKLQTYLNELGNYNGTDVNSEMVGIARANGLLGAFFESVDFPGNNYVNDALAQILKVCPESLNFFELSSSNYIKGLGNREASDFINEGESKITILEAMLAHAPLSDEDHKQAELYLHELKGSQLFKNVAEASSFLNPEILSKLSGVELTPEQLAKIKGNYRPDQELLVTLAEMSQGGDQEIQAEVIGGIKKVGLSHPDDEGDKAVAQAMLNLIGPDKSIITIATYNKANNLGHVLGPIEEELSKLYWDSTLGFRYKEASKSVFEARDKEIYKKQAAADRKKADEEAARQKAETETQKAIIAAQNNEALNLPHVQELLSKFDYTQVTPASKLMDELRGLADISDQQREFLSTFCREINGISNLEGRDSRIVSLTDKTIPGKKGGFLGIGRTPDSTIRQAVADHSKIEEALKKITTKYKPDEIPSVEDQAAIAALTQIKKQLPQKS